MTRVDDNSNPIPVYVLICITLLCCPLITTGVLADLGCRKQVGFKFVEAGSHVEAVPIGCKRSSRQHQMVRSSYSLALFVLCLAGVAVHLNSDSTDWSLEVAS